MISLCEKVRRYGQVGERDLGRELGEPTAKGRWLVASPEKIIRLQPEFSRSAQRVYYCLYIQYLGGSLA